MTAFISEKGNALFFVFIGIALFALLSYAIASSGNKSGNSVDAERASVYATQILQEFKRYETAYNRLRMVEGYKQIHFNEEAENASGSIYTGDTATSNGLTVGLFNSAHELSVPNLPSEIFYSAAGQEIGIMHTEIYIDSNSDGTKDMNYGTTEYDDLIRIYRVNADVCKGFNSKVHGSGDIPDFTQSTLADGNFTYYYDFVTSTYTTSTSSSNPMVPRLPICAALNGNADNMQIMYPITQR